MQVHRGKVLQEPYILIPDEVILVSEMRYGNSIHLFAFSACSFQRCQLQMRLQTCLMSREILALDQLEAEERVGLLAVKVLVASEIAAPAALVILAAMVVPLIAVVGSTTLV